MPRQGGTRLNFQFNKGWITEANPMSFPEGTMQDVDNCILDIDGSIRRRPGINYDKQSIYFGDVGGVTATNAVGFFEWTNVGGNGTLGFTVTQVGTKLYFHIQAGPDTVDNLVGSISFAGFATDTTAATKNVVSVTSGLGYLFVVGEFIEPFYVTYDENAGTLSTTPITIKIRDFEGADDGLDVDERPTTLSNLHEYNLRNQGWPSSFQNIYKGADKATSDPVQYTFDKEGVYPSNADILNFGKTGSGTDEDDVNRYDPSTMFKNVFGTTPAARGKYTFNAFDINRGTIVAGATRTRTLRRPQAVAFHNGRVFYSGVNATGFTSNVYYSQQLTDVEKVGNCFQENDPTAEEFNELLATDGGLITIPNAGGILALLEGPAGIIVFASNGIWEITGQEGKFSATEFYVRKVTDMGCVGRETVLNADGSFLYWSSSGIISLQPDQVTSNLSPQNLTQNTIQTGYLLIGGVQQQWARGVYIQQEKKAVWIYSTNPAYDGASNRFRYNGVLILDLQLGAFYKYSISDTATTTPYVAGITKTAPFVSTLGAEPVTAGGTTVTAGGETVTAGTAAGVTSDVEVSAWKFLVVRTDLSNRLTMGEFTYDGFYDWYYHDGVGADYTSFAETGYDHGGMPIYDKKPTYIWTYLSRYSKTRLQGGYYNIGLGTTEEYSSWCDNLNNIAYASLTYPIGHGTGVLFDVAVSFDGTKMFLLDGWDKTIYQYTLSTPYDCSTATYDSVSLDVSATHTTVNSLQMSDNGLKMYITGGASPAVTVLSEWTMTTANDLSTATLTNTLTPGQTGIFAIIINSDGTKGAYAATGTGLVYGFTLSTPYDLSTLATNSTYDFTSETASALDLAFDRVGDKMYLLGNTNVLYDYDMNNFDISTVAPTGNDYTFAEPTEQVSGFDMRLSANAETYLYMTDTFNQAAANSGTAVYQYDIDCCSPTVALARTATVKYLVESESVETTVYADPNYDDSGWSTAPMGFYKSPGGVKSHPWTKINELGAAGFQTAIPDDSNVWIRSTLTLTEASTVDFKLYRDDNAFLWIDGVLQSITTIESGYSTFQTELEAGTYSIVYKVEDSDVATGSGNYIYAAYAIETTPATCV